MLMRTFLRVSLALLTALALSTTVYAQSPVDDRVSFNASIGPSFANLGTTFSTRAELDVEMTDRVSLVGEFGILPRAPFADATEIAPPMGGADVRRVNAYHLNGNVLFRPFEVRQVSPYVTAGVGTFTADAVGATQTVNGISVHDRRRVTDFATNVGAGLNYRVNEWVGLNADYRTFFVHRDADDPRVHRFTTGISLFLK
jgi:opacity protein-like surface antigen